MADGRAQMAESSIPILSGRFKGRRLKFSATPSLAPTQGILRKSLGDRFMHRLASQKHFTNRILEGFAGTGAVGVEILSRGATEAVFIEQDRSLALNLQKNLAQLGMTLRSTSLSSPQTVVDPPDDRSPNITVEVIASNFFHYLQKILRINSDISTKENSDFCLIYLDPPYRLFTNVRLRLQTLLLIASSGLLHPDGEIVIERPNSPHHFRQQHPSPHKDFTPLKNSSPHKTPSPHPTKIIKQLLADPHFSSLRVGAKHSPAFASPSDAFIRLKDAVTELGKTHHSKVDDQIQQKWLDVVGLKCIQSKRFNATLLENYAFA